jgi:hypothetical protein
LSFLTSLSISGIQKPSDFLGERSGRPENPKARERERRPFESMADIELIHEWLFLNVSQVKPKLLKTKPKLLKTYQLEILLSDFFNGDYTRRSF